MHGFKEYCALLFIKGALLNDSAGLLIQQTENVQAGRQIRFTSIKEIEALEATLRSYIEEAIRMEVAGLKIVKKQTCDFAVPEEFQRILLAQPALKAAFEALSPGAGEATYSILRSKSSQRPAPRGWTDAYPGYLTDSDWMIRRCRWMCG